LEYVGGMIAGGVILGFGLLITWFVSLGERTLSRLDWVIFTLGFAVALTIVFAGAVWVFPRALAILDQVLSFLSIVLENLAETEG
jgi:hypothetical protein